MDAVATDSMGVQIVVGDVVREAWRPDEDFAEESGKVLSVDKTRIVVRVMWRKGAPIELSQGQSSPIRTTDPKKWTVGR
jgi:hypothetical protein